LLLRDSISGFLNNIQKKLFPLLEEELGPLTEKHQKLIRTLEMLRIEEFVKLQYGYRGRPEKDRKVLSRAYVAKAVYNITETKKLIDKILTDSTLREICGWSSLGEVPSESTFSRVFSEFSNNKLPQVVHESLIKRSYSDHIVGHVSRDSTAIEAREKPVWNKEKKAPPKYKRGRPKKGEEREKELSRLEGQVDMTIEAMLEDLPKVCDKGNKVDSKGYKKTWTGYKFHIDTGDGDVPLSCILTSASVHDSQVALPLAGITNQRVVNLYDLMDSAYDSPIIREHSRLLNHVPIIDINPRRNIELKLRLKQESKCLRILNKKMPESLRYNERSSVERVNGRLKDEFGGRDIRVRGHIKVMTHLMFGILALTVDQLCRFTL